MALVYKFRVTFEDYDEVTRDIEIKSIQSFEEFHHTIQSAIGFDAIKPASFFMSTDHWIKDQEISSIQKTNKEGEALPLMRDARLCDYVADPHQKIIYVSDPEANWSFYIELLKIIPTAELGKNYPTCVKSVGEAPKQYAVVNPAKIKVSPEDALAAALLADDDLEEAAEGDDLKEDMMDVADDGVEMDEIDGMGEEGEEDSEEEKDEEADSMSELEDDQQDDY